jgi:nucleoside 2-deoxyribosyltransferase
MKIFLGAPFTQDISDETKIMHTHKVEHIMNLIGYLQKKGHSVTNAHTREKFGEELMPPHVCTKKDYDEVKNCDVFVAVVGNPASGGVQVELGWASALNKKIIVLLYGNGKYSPLVDGLSSVADAKIIRVEDETKMHHYLEDVL